MIKLCTLFLTLFLPLLVAISSNTPRADTYFKRPDMPCPTQRRPDLIVFVHGVTGSTETWKGDKGAYWPTIVENDNIFENADILVYEYPSPKLWASYSVGGLADRLAT